MEIKNNYTNQTNFKAIKVATVQRCLKKQTAPIDIYKLTPKDNNFLDKLLNKINYKELFPNLTEYEQKVWQDIFRYCVFNAQNKHTSSYIAITENKPCGIICYAKDKITDLIGICAIPTQKCKKTPLIGKTLFYQLFQDTIKNKSKGIQLEAVNDSPINVIQKYMDLGFKKTSSEGRYTKMEINQHRIKDSIAKLNKLINFSETKHIDTNLESTLD